MGRRKKVTLNNYITQDPVEASVYRTTKDFRAANNTRLLDMYTEFKTRMIDEYRARGERLTEEMVQTEFIVLVMTSLGCINKRLFSRVAAHYSRMFYDSEQLIKFTHEIMKIKNVYA
jgi:hypothetical protein